ncbi:MAG: hypothetical protein PVJ67_05310 [Candidatus Pacearchaeota archaeon]|jgi:hypothetical protein
MENRRGQGLSTNAIILIVLGVVVLAVLIIGFTIGWNKIAPWLGGGNNIDTIVTQCNVACSTNSVDGFCNMKREVKGASFEDGEYTCEDLIDKKIGVEDCSSICPSTEGKTYSWVTSLNECVGDGMNVVTNPNCADIPKVDGKNICCERS